MNLSLYIDPLSEFVTSKISVGELRDLLEERNLQSIPIIDDGEYIGIITEEDLDAELDNEKEIGKLRFFFPKPHVQFSNHIMDAVALAADLQLSQVPVLSLDNKYEGSISMQKLVSAMGEMTCFSEPGGILEISTSINKYSPSEIARIVESEGAVLLALATHFIRETSQVRITLKLNFQKVAGLAGIFDHYGYDVPAVFNDEEYFEMMRNRYDNLMSIWKEQQ